MLTKTNPELLRDACDKTRQRHLWRTLSKPLQVRCLLLCLVADTRRRLSGQSRRRSEMRSAEIKELGHVVRSSIACRQRRQPEAHLDQLED